MANTQSQSGKGSSSPGQGEVKDPKNDGRLKENGGGKQGQSMSKDSKDSKMDTKAKAGR